MTSREQFEKYILSIDRLVVKTSAGDNYDDEEVEFAWTVWQASRNSLEIKLPPAINTEEIGVAISKERTMARLAFAGIKVKGE